METERREKEETGERRRERDRGEVQRGRERGKKTNRRDKRPRYRGGKEERKEVIYRGETMESNRGEK